MMLEQCGCALCAGVVLNGTLSWGACRIGDIFGGATELGVSLFSVTSCLKSSAS